MQLLEASEIDPALLQSQTDNINKSNILERLIKHLQGQIFAFKNQSDKKVKVINTLIEQVEK